MAKLRYIQAHHPLRHYLLYTFHTLPPTASLPRTCNSRRLLPRPPRPRKNPRRSHDAWPHNPQPQSARPGRRRSTTPACLLRPRSPPPTIAVAVLFRGRHIQLPVVGVQRPRKQMLAKSLGERVRVGVAQVGHGLDGFFSRPPCRLDIVAAAAYHAGILSTSVEALRVSTTEVRQLLGERE